MDRGPEGDTPAARQFRQFWGDVCQLRRFPDGSVAEAVVWKCESEDDKRLVCGRIVQHLLQRHAALPKRTVHYLANSWFDTLALRRIELPSIWPSYQWGSAYLSGCITAYDELTHHLRALTNLPLAIKDIRSTAPALRHTDPFPPLPATFAVGTKASQQPLTPSIPVQIILEASSRWPADLQAVRRLKTAFLLCLAEGLKQRGLTVFLRQTDRMQVWHKSLSFQVEVVHMGEIALSRKVSLPDGRVKHEDTLLYHQHKWHLDFLPTLSAALAGVSRQYEPFGTACRLGKRWISTQMLSGYISGEVVECIMAHIFLKPSHQRAPVAPELAFLRFLHVLSSHDWTRQPLIVDFGGNVKREKMKEMEDKFTHHRQIFPAMSILLSFDEESLLTKQGLPSVILKRAVALAKLALASSLPLRITSQPWLQDPKVLFRAAIDDSEWDVIVHLRGKRISRLHESLDEPTKNHTSLSMLKYLPHNKAPNVSQVMVDFDTVDAYVKRVRHLYDHCGYFLADPAATVMVVKWKKEAFAAVKREEGMTGQKKGKDDQLMMDPAVIVEDLALIVLDVPYVQTAPFNFASKRAEAPVACNLVNVNVHPALVDETTDSSLNMSALPGRPVAASSMRVDPSFSHSLTQEAQSQAGGASASGQPEEEVEADDEAGLGCMGTSHLMDLASSPQCVQH